MTAYIYIYIEHAARCRWVHCITGHDKLTPRAPRTYAETHDNCAKYIAAQRSALLAAYALAASRSNTHTHTCNQTYTLSDVATHSRACAYPATIPQVAIHTSHARRRLAKRIHSSTILQPAVWLQRIMIEHTTLRLRCVCHTFSCTYAHTYTNWILWHYRYSRTNEHVASEHQRWYGGRNVAIVSIERILIQYPVNIWEQFALKMP